MVEELVAGVLVHFDYEGRHSQLMKRCTAGTTSSSAGNAIAQDSSHACIQMRMKFAVKPTPCAVATMETNRVMKPETSDADRTGASAAGMVIFFMEELC
jgi:hypothetical protein